MAAGRAALLRWLGESERERTAGSRWPTATVSSAPRPQSRRMGCGRGKQFQLIPISPN
eukprot:SAG31_NODE_4087_length_3601_cov_3.169903_3_plen_58_part_00